MPENKEQRIERIDPVEPSKQRYPTPPIDRSINNESAPTLIDPTPPSVTNTVPPEPGDVGQGESEKKSND